METKYPLIVLKNLKTQIAQEIIGLILETTQDINSTTVSLYGLDTNGNLAYWTDCKVSMKLKKVLDELTIDYVVYDKPKSQVQIQDLLSYNYSIYNSNILLPEPVTYSEKISNTSYIEDDELSKLQKSLKEYIESIQIDRVDNNQLSKSVEYVESDLYYNNEHNQQQTQPDIKQEHTRQEHTQPDIQQQQPYIQEQPDTQQQHQEEDILNSIISESLSDNQYLQPSHNILKNSDNQQNKDYKSISFENLKGGEEMDLDKILDLDKIKLDLEDKENPIKDMKDEEDDE